MFLVRPRGVYSRRAFGGEALRVVARIAPSLLRRELGEIVSVRCVWLALWRVAERVSARGLGS